MKPAAILSAVILLLAAVPLDAQLPSGAPEQLLKGATVRKLIATPEHLTLTRGDSAAIEIHFLNGDGEPVKDIAWAAFSRAQSISIATETEAEPKVKIAAGGPTEAQVYVFVRVPPDSGSFFGVDGLKLLDSIGVSVSDWPLAKVVIEEPAFHAYVGTTFRMHAVPVTDHETVHQTARITWRSEDPGTVQVTDDGVVSLLGKGKGSLVASSNGVMARYELDVRENPVRQLAVTPRTVETRTGDVVHFAVRALDRKGKPVEGMALSYAVSPLDSAGAEVFPDGAFVAENPGTYRVIVSAGTAMTEALVRAEARPKASGVRLVGRGAVKHVATSDLWVFSGRDGRDYAYTGTHAQGGGQRLFVWDVTDPSNVELKDSVVVDARVVNDVKVNGNATWAVITREGASDRKNGMVVLDLADPAHPRVAAELTEGMTGGVHNSWINGDVVYVTNDGTGAMNIVDMSDPYHPQMVGTWEIRPGETDKTLHDIWSDGRYAYVSYWDDGLVILDVGAGTHGGTPTTPKVVSRYAYPIGNTHVAFREGNYVFVGDEIFGCKECVNGPRGYIHVIDVQDIEHPKEVARYEVPEAGAHNIWVENGVLYVAYYQGGLRIVDVSGELRGDLYRQGREIGWFVTSAGEDEAVTPNSPMAWGPQLFKGNVFVSDLNSGLWILHHDRPKLVNP